MVMPLGSAFFANAGLHLLASDQQRALLHHGSVITGLDT